MAQGKYITTLDRAPPNSNITKNRHADNINTNFLRNCPSPLMKPLKFLSAWLLFATSYIIFYIPVFKYFPERWLLNIVRKHYDQFIEESVWVDAVMSIIFFITLIINVIFIFLALSAIKVLRRFKYSSDA